jgi:hypothetical protein
MGLQEIAALITLLLAVTYLSVRLYRALRRKDCAGACKGCGSIDLSKIDTSKFKQ